MRTVEVDVYVVRTTPSGYACARDRDEVDRGHTFFLPDSQVSEASQRQEVYNGARFYVLTIPEWLATKEGLI